MVASLRLARGSLFAGDFRVIRSIGHGGLGTVYEAEQLSAHRVRALKVLHPQFVEDEGIRARFEQEARVAAHIPSPHVVQVIASGVDEASGAPWMAMELLRGEDLEAAMNHRGRFPPEEVLEIFRQLCHAVGQAHGLGIVHRDLKPENVFMARAPSADEAPTVKVLDFGIAKWVDDNRTSQENSQLIGTPLWMAPEQAQRSASIRPATDVWALGLLAFRLLTGRAYWKSAGPPPSVAALLSELLNEPLETASHRASMYGCAGLLPPGFDGWFGRCVVRDSTRRFSDANKAFAALDQLFGAASEDDAGEGGDLLGDTMQLDGVADQMRASVGVAATMMAPTPVRTPPPPPSRMAIGEAATMVGPTPVARPLRPGPPVAPPFARAAVTVGPPVPPPQVFPPPSAPSAPPVGMDLSVPLPVAPRLGADGPPSPGVKMVLGAVLVVLVVAAVAVMLLRR